MTRGQWVQRSRSTLHQSKVEQFALFCQENGWQRRDVKGLYEVLRMVHPEKRHPLLVFKRDAAKEHLTTYGHSAVMLALYMKARKEKST